ncbi:MAG: DUF502 domain-containing protein [Planctomycetes bacterium]|nr:DUF502 domain-containing protein [Planctomycetota bacterium]
MKPLSIVLKYFLRGLLVLAPFGLTLWFLWWIFERIDQLLPLPEYVAPGVGFVAVVTIVVAVGALTSNFILSQAIDVSDRLLGRVPFVKLVYNSLKDLTQAFVGQKKRFDQPVVVEIAAGIRMLGFVTRPDLSDYGMPDEVAVYLPQSYNFAANLLIVPRSRVQPLDKPASEVLAFVVSGGLASGPGE